MRTSDPSGMRAERTREACQLLTVRDVAELLKVHARSVWRLAAQAEAGLSDFPTALRLGPKTVRWRASDIAAYLARLTRQNRP